MLEILSHKYLKRFVSVNMSDWQNIYSFGRIISLSLRKRENYLINSEIFLTTKWYPALLISLLLNKDDAILVLSKENFGDLFDYLPLLKDIGLNFSINSNEILLASHKIQILTLDELISTNKDAKITKHTIVFDGAENLKKDLKNIFRISLNKNSWLENLRNNHNFYFEKTYNNLKKKFFLRALPNKNYVYLSDSEIRFFKYFFSKYYHLSTKFLNFKNVFQSNWATWVILDYENFEWILIAEPLDEFIHIKELLANNHNMFLSSLRKDLYYRNYLNSHNLNIKKAINFQSDFPEKKFSIYLPNRQMLPNNPFFYNLIIKQVHKLVLFRSGFNLILCDDEVLKLKLATNLASKYGKQILLDNMPCKNNQILCSSYQWWIRNSKSSQLPNRIILPLLPIPNMSEPFTQINVSYKNNQSEDWFREFLLPETIETLDKVISPLRRNAGELLILDGRIQNRQWGRDIIAMLQPSDIIPHIFPFD